MQGEHLENRKSEVRVMDALSLIVRPDRDLEDLIPTFMANRRQEFSEMATAIQGNDFNLIKRTAHTWKGISRPYGFVYLETLSRSLEVAGDQNDRLAVESVLAEIDNYLTNVKIVYEDDIQ
jgi:HPt (histidine-containing phosphotransfer) domain-containing protein